jgi:tripartite-type tricarboxylate transporter receptor subunit TctC
MGPRFRGDDGKGPIHRLSFITSAAFLALASLSSAASAQNYPNHLVRILVPFPAGGAADALTRLVAPKLQEAWGQPVIIDNRGGAGGTVGVAEAAKAAPDGYTILQNTNGQAISPALYRNLPFDVFRDFVPVTQMVATATVLVASPKLPARSVKELIALAKSKPGKLNYGSTGVGNSLHLTMEMFKRAAGIDIQAIPYRGDGPVNTALIAGDVDVAIVPIATVIPLIESGHIRPLAVNSARRSPLLPNVPTVAEEALPGFEAAGWQGFFVPAGTPRGIVNTIYRATATVIAAPDMQERLRTMNNEPVGSSPEEFAEKFKADVDKFRQVVRDAGIPPQD